jgi:hypothetical protein
MPDKERELFHLTRLMEADPRMRGGLLEADERPDAFLTKGGTRVGIEVTVFHQPTPDGELPNQVNEARRATAVRRAMELHEARGGPPAELEVRFDLSHRITSKKEIVTTAEHLAAAILRLDVPIATHVIVANGWQTTAKEISAFTKQPAIIVSGKAYTALRLPLGVREVVTYRHPEQVHRRWTAASDGPVTKCSPADLQGVIDRKEARRASYLSRCDQAWLVVVFDAYSLSVPVYFTALTTGHTYTSAFDRIVLFEPHTQRFAELQLASAPQE